MAGRGPDDLAHPCRHQENGGNFPTPRQGQERDRQEVQTLDGKNNGPAAAQTIGKMAGGQAQGVYQKLPQGLLQQGHRGSLDPPNKKAPEPHGVIRSHQRQSGSSRDTDSHTPLGPGAGGVRGLLAAAGGATRSQVVPGSHNARLCRL